MKKEINKSELNRRDFIRCLFIAGGGLILAGCSGEATQTLTDTLAIATKLPETPKPSLVIKPTDTPQPSNSPTPSETATKTPEPSNTPTETTTSTPKELTLEQKFGNLVPMDERAVCVEGIGEMYHDQGELSYQYRSARIGVRSTGAVTGSWKYIEAINEEAYILRQEVVFRDGLGILKKMDVETGLADKNNWPSIGVAIDCDTDNCGSSEGNFDNQGVGIYRVRPVEEALAYYCCQSGQRLLVEFAYERPDVCPKKKVYQDGTTNMANIASYNLWIGEKSELANLASQMFKRGEIDVPEGLILPAQAAFILMSHNSILDLYYRFADG